ncbi:MAG: YkgJ family cysteine cluster protein [Chthoniobacteraceae bacterium]
MSTESVASELCNSCGMCCNGVMFHLVQLQPGDSPNELLERGLKLKWKRGHRHIQQPCPAYCESRCTIYEIRPERCRAFECRVLKRLLAGEITEAEAAGKVDEVKTRVADLEEMLTQSGVPNTRKPLTKRFDTATAIPLHESDDVEELELRQDLVRAMDELETLLQKDFRVPKYPSEE